MNDSLRNLPKEYPSFEEVIANSMCGVPIMVRSIDGTPILKVFLDIFKMTGFFDELPPREEMEQMAELIARKNGCEFNKYGPSFYKIVRHPRDIRLGNVIETKKIWHSVNNAQMEFNLLFAEIVARSIVGELLELDEEGLLYPALKEIGITSYVAL